MILSNQVKFTGEKIVSINLDINKFYFNKFTTHQSLIEDIKLAFEDDYWTSESIEDLVAHEFGHFLFNANTFSEFVKKRKLLKFVKIDVSEYGRTNGIEALAEIFALFMKNVPVKKEWKDFFNKYVANGYRK